jgi:hypothetical protein
LKRSGAVRSQGLCCSWGQDTLFGDIFSKRHIVHGMHCPRGVTSKNHIIPQNTCSGTHRSGSASQTKKSLFQWTVVGQPGLLGPAAARTAFTTGRWQTADKFIPLQKNSPNTLLWRVTYYQLIKTVS